MALYNGLTGYIKINNKLIAHMSNFSLEMSADMIEVISFGNEYKEKLPSVKDWSATGDGKCDFDNGSGQEDLIEAHQGNELVTVGLGITEGIFFEGTGYIENISIDNSSDDSPSFNIGIAGSNALFLTNTLNPKLFNIKPLETALKALKAFREEDYKPTSWALVPAYIEEIETVVKDYKIYTIVEYWNTLDDDIKIEIQDGFYKLTAEVYTFIDDLERAE